MLRPLAATHWPQCSTAKTAALSQGQSLEPYDVPRRDSADTRNFGHGENIEAIHCLALLWPGIVTDAPTNCPHSRGSLTIEQDVTNVQSFKSAFPPTLKGLLQMPIGARSIRIMHCDKEFEVGALPSRSDTENSIPRHRSGGTKWVSNPPVAVDAHRSATVTVRRKRSLRLSMEKW
jgi:hypothetical protein